jgi:arsenate reductase
MHPPTLYGIPNCDTVRKARAFLEARGAAYAFHDFRRQGLDAGRLDAWLASPAGGRLLNRQGTTWRALPEADKARAAADPAAARGLMLAQPSLVKRPVVEWPDGGVTVGFDAADWAARLDGKA